MNVSHTRARASDHHNGSSYGDIQHIPHTATQTHTHTAHNMSGSVRLFAEAHVARDLTALSRRLPAVTRMREYTESATDQLHENRLRRYVAAKTRELAAIRNVDPMSYEAYVHYRELQARCGANGRPTLLLFEKEALAKERAAAKRRERARTRAEAQRCGMEVAIELPAASIVDDDDEEETDVSARDAIQSLCGMLKRSVLGSETVDGLTD